MINHGDILNIILAHTNNPTKPSKAMRKWDGVTPYFIHPLWCATTILTEAALSEETRRLGAQVLLYHDILEDTTSPLPTTLLPQVVEMIEDMTFRGGTKEEMVRVWEKPAIIRLFKLYDKTSNLLDATWMDDEKWVAYVGYTSRLCGDVEQNFGRLNITILARALISGLTRDNT